jgi:hypothetical protein
VSSMASFAAEYSMIALANICLSSRPAEQGIMRDFSSFRRMLAGSRDLLELVLLSGVSIEMPREVMCLRGLKR